MSNEDTESNDVQEFRIKALEEQCKTLAVKVTSLETQRVVAIVLLVAVGLSGGFIWSIATAAQEKVNKIQLDLGESEKKIADLAVKRGEIATFLESAKLALVAEKNDLYTQLTKDSKTLVTQSLDPILSPIRERLTRIYALPQHYPDWVTFGREMSALCSSKVAADLKVDVVNCQ